MTNNPVGDAIAEYWGDRCSDYEPGCPCCEAWAQYDALTPASAEPVAYQVAMSGGRWGTIFHHPDKPLGNHRPLYTHPAPMTVEAAIKRGAEMITKAPDGSYRVGNNGYNRFEDALEDAALRALSGEKS